MGFDVVELSVDFISLSADDLLRLVEQVTRAGTDIIMIESEGITENVKTWRTDVVARIIDGVGLKKVMFEAPEPEVFE